MASFAKTFLRLMALPEPDPDLTSLPHICSCHLCPHCGNARTWARSIREGKSISRRRKETGPVRCDAVTTFR